MSYDENAVTGWRELPQPLQEVDDSEGFFRKTEECRDDFQIVSRCSLSERYLKSDFSVVLQLAVKGNAPSVGVGSGKNNIELLDGPVVILQFHAANPDNREHW